MNASEKFTEELVELIYKRYPKALQGDIGQHAEATNAMAVAIAGMIAFSFRLNGEVMARTTLQSVVKKIVETAGEIDAKAGELIKQSIPTILH
jgi:hypothetical protein